MRPSLRNAIASAALAFGLGMTPQAADAAVIIIFSQQAGGGEPITATAIGGAQTTLTANNVPVMITELGGTNVALNAFFDLSATSDGAAIGALEFGQQAFDGTFSITSTPSGGTNFLSGTFDGLLFSSFLQVVGASGSLIASDDALASVTFTSDVFSPSPLGDPSSFSFSLSGTNDNGPSPAICGSTLCGFTASIAGSASAVASIPEPASLALFGAGLFGIGIARRYRGKTQA